jgi:hypothetical protein
VYIVRRVPRLEPLGTGRKGPRRSVRRGKVAEHLAGERPEGRQQVNRVKKAGRFALCTIVVGSGLSIPGRTRDVVPKVPSTGRWRPEVSPRASGEILALSPRKDWMVDHGPRENIRSAPRFCGKNPAEPWIHQRSPAPDRRTRTNRELADKPGVAWRDRPALECGPGTMYSWSSPLSPTLPSLSPFPRNPPLSARGNGESGDEWPHSQSRPAWRSTVVRRFGNL